ncbi:hypothetical protein EVAR_11284_1 [Eumeta japonica]|uniref:Uncharacterized protein n=1 Tax=Eumeta variegata TaxID=151549 RepID=A0A4C1UKR7_EUMVA|nr:hypothetical protein EVAR_11284_1 [Eumeta japonica]
MYLQIILLACAILKFRYAQIINDSENTKEDVHDCVGRLLQVKNISDLTVVNLNDNDALAKIVYGETLPRLVVNRNYLSSDLMIYNSAYLIYSTKYEELIAGMTNLTKDVYWNPRASIIIAIKEINENAIKEAFQYLYFLNAFHSSIVTQANDDETYIYQNMDSKNELTRIYCKNKTSIRYLNLLKYLKDDSDNMTLIVDDKPPYTFIQNNSENKPIGYDEIFLNIANEFSNITITPTFRTQTSSLGSVLDNFTVTEEFRKVQTGEVDGVFGATGPFRHIQNKEADGVSGGYVLTENRVRVFDFTYPHLPDHLLFVVPKSKPMTK